MFKLYIFSVLLPYCFGSVEEALGLLSVERGLWNCVSNLNVKCVENYALQPLSDFFIAKEIPLGSSFVLENTQKHSSVGSGRVFGSDPLEWSGFVNLLGQYFKSHAIKFQVGQFEGRLLGVDSKRGDFEFSLARKSSSGKSQRIYRVIIPLVVGFKITGLIIFGLVTVKLFLLKATMIANTALLVAGGIVLKKLYDHGMGMLTQHHGYLHSHTSLPNFNSHDFSGYGYHGFEDNLNDGSDAHKTEWPEFGDLHGQFSNHAIAMAALNKTLLTHQAQQPLIQHPKRRWSQSRPWLINSNWTHF